MTVNQTAGFAYKMLLSWQDQYSMRYSIQAHNIEVCGVTKATCGHPDVARAMLRGGDELAFIPSYCALLAAMTSKYVQKCLC